MLSSNGAGPAKDTLSLIAQGAPFFPATPVLSTGKVGDVSRHSRHTADNVQSLTKFNQMKKQDWLISKSCHPAVCSSSFSGSNGAVFNFFFFFLLSNIFWLLFPRGRKKVEVVSDKLWMAPLIFHKSMVIVNATSGVCFLSPRPLPRPQNTAAVITSDVDVLENQRWYKIF